jgi:uncharacterized protein Yka (UPF0111/DUF47 family)
MNNLDKVYLKTAEELSELVTRLLQNINKKKDYTDKIQEEINDVEKQIKLLKIELSKIK